MGFELSAATVPGYLADCGLVADADAVDASELGGGVSNVVVDARADGERFVCKQPLPNLAVEDDWPADVVRVHNEAAAARAFADALPENGTVSVPAVHHEDETNHVVVFEGAPDSATMWKDELLDGDVDADVAGAVGRALGTVHAGVAGDAAVRERFGDETPFLQLRIDPYHRTVAERHPDLTDAIEHEIERTLGVKRTLVHGDYSPKNVLVDRAGADTTVWLLDFEVAHWGDPAFDVAFMCNHLCLKSLYNADRQEEYLGAAARFWREYEAAVEWDVEASIVRELGVLMLARVDGKSPVEYVRREALKDDVRAVARAAIRDPPDALDSFFDLVRERGDRPATSRGDEAGEGQR
jgi:5-methylthioribose kinase